MQNTKEIKIGNVFIGGSHPILIQSMTNTPTKDINNSDGGEISFDELIVTYNDGSSKEVTGFTYPTTTLKAGTTYVTVSYIEANGYENIASVEFLENAENTDELINTIK